MSDAISLARYLILPLSYLLGALPFSYITVRAVRGVDLRHSGSGNLGTANTARAAGLLPALLVFVGDAGKGALAMTLAVRVFGRGPWALAALAAVVLGHNFSVFVCFSGGKGLAAAAGALAVLSPGLFFATATLGLVALGASADFYLAAMAMAAALPGLAVLFLPGRAVLLTTLITSAAILVRHRVNLPGLWAGERQGGVGEDRFALFAGLAAVIAIVLIQIRRLPLQCQLLPVAVIAARWAGIGLLVMAAWAAASGASRKGIALTAGGVTACATAVAIGLVFTAASGGSHLALPTWAEQIGDGSWPAGQASVAAVAAHHLFWVIGLAAAGSVSRALKAPPR